MVIPADYEERVYAGVVGKIVGVYLGRPVEGWSPQRIEQEIGTITGYVHDRVGVPLVVTDDDITGTFTFFRALEDSGFDPELSAEAIGRAWLNYIIEERTILWWGGLGHSTEHTAYLRLKAGIPAPRSGSAELNGRIVAEQIGAQIFIDAWAMAAPGDPQLAARLARAAASVSHDGAAVDAAVLLAAIEAQAFVEPDLGKLLDAGLALIPADSVIASLAADLRALRQHEPDWRAARSWLEEHYGPSRFKGNVHIVPNHGLILLSLLWGEDDFSTTLSIVNTCGWDTDCNSGNVGCLMGIKNGLRGMEGPVDWRGPVRDRLYLPTAEGGRAITDAVVEAGRIAAAGRQLSGEKPRRPKGGARYHFSFPGSVQGFAIHRDGAAAELLENVPHPSLAGDRVLRIPLAPRDKVVVATDTFIPPEDQAMPGYRLLASPSLHPGQRIQATVIRDPAARTAVDVALVVAHYTGLDDLRWVPGPFARAQPGVETTLDWVAPGAGGQPIAKVGLMVGGGSGGLLLDRLDWSGAPDTPLGKPADGGTMWRRAWVDGVSIWNIYWNESFRIAQNDGVGLLSQGSLEWADYAVRATVTPHQATSVGIAARIGGLRRWYALQLVAGGVRLVACLDTETVLAQADAAWEPYERYELALEVVANRIRGWLDGRLVCDALDDRLASGAAGLIVEEGTLVCDALEVRPAS
jgi:hypothetical protein